ncbi:MAG TPA: Hsp20/alpha crystallin family protein [Candidatus Polarisedimenticolia bacterium]|jgi:HSP20 family protein|nr:Hsp20/alpha crystallin family protein [Candidatus Polarisedimenticolia bacterium]
MNSLTRWEQYPWDPFKELETIGNRFNRLMGQLPMRYDVGREAMTAADWVPNVDVSEDDKEYLIKAEIPEVDRKDVKVTVHQGILTLQGTRKKETEEKSKRFHRVERSYGSFFRSFIVPEDASEEKMKAEFKDGMLLVHLPKNENPKARMREVKIE